jgi:hypothetical protein
MRAHVRLTVATTLVFGSVWLLPQVFAQTQSTALVGTWKLVSWESADSNGEVTRPLGDHPVGFLMYGADGRMCIEMMNPNRPKFASGDPLNGTIDEVRGAFETFNGYCASYSLDEQRSTVTHRIDVSPFPNFVGTDQVRFLTLSVDRLTLRTPPRLLGGRTGTSALVWERLR